VPLFCQASPSGRLGGAITSFVKFPRRREPTNATGAEAACGLCPARRRKTKSISRERDNEAEEIPIYMGMTRVGRALKQLQFHRVNGPLQAVYKTLPCG